MVYIVYKFWQKIYKTFANNNNKKKRRKIR